MKCPKKYENESKSIDIHGKVHQFLIAKSQILVFKSDFLFTSKKKASALIVPTVKLCSIKNVVKRKDKFTLQYKVFLCLIYNSLMRLPIFEVILAYVL